MYHPVSSIARSKAAARPGLPFAWQMYAPPPVSDASGSRGEGVGEELLQLGRVEVVVLDRGEPGGGAALRPVAHVGDAVGRVREEQVCLASAERVLHVVDGGRVAALQPVRTELVDLAGDGLRLLRRIGDRVLGLVHVPEAVGIDLAQDPGHLIVVEPGLGEVRVLGLQLAQDERQAVVIPLGDLGQAVVRQGVELRVVGREVQPDDWDLCEPDPLGGFDPRVARDDDPVLAPGQHGVRPPESLE
jgi:hypothetical protein